jgi:hypothetical protein
MPDKLKSEMKLLMATHAAQPLLVYKVDEYVNPKDINMMLKNALVEVHFSLKLYRIYRKGEGIKPFDSFSGIVKQVIILQPGDSPGPNNYKCKNFPEGPYRPKPFTAPDIRAPHITQITTTSPPSSITPPTPVNPSDIVGRNPILLNTSVPIGVPNVSPVDGFVLGPTLSSVNTIAIPPLLASPPECAPNASTGPSVPQVVLLPILATAGPVNEIAKTP